MVYYVAGFLKVPCFLERTVYPPATEHTILCISLGLRPLSVKFVYHCRIKQDNLLKFMTGVY